MFSFRSSIVSGFTLRSVIHSDLTSVYSMRTGPTFLWGFLQMNFPLFQHHVLRRLYPFSTEKCYCTFGKISFPNRWGSISGFSVLSPRSVFRPVTRCLHHSNSVLRLTIPRCQISNVVLLFQSCGCSKFFAVLYGI